MLMLCGQEGAIVVKSPQFSFHFGRGHPEEAKVKIKGDVKVNGVGLYFE